MPAGDAEAHRVWSSLPGVLPLASVRGIALLLPAGSNDADFFATDPSQRGLVRALEAARILPVALPGLLCCNASTICYIDFDEPCAGPHASLLVALTGAVVRLVAAARGVPPTAIPIVTAGLSSGGGAGGLLAAHMRVAAVFAQLEPPAPSMIEAYRSHGHNDTGGGNTTIWECRITDPASRVTMPSGATASVAELAAASTLLPPSPSAPPALWLTGASANQGEQRAMRRFADRWLEATAGSGAGSVDPDRYVFNSWAPTALSAAELHRAAPWLLSHAAAASLIEAALAVGLLHVPSAAQRAAVASYRPWCDRDGAFSDELWTPRAAQNAAAAAAVVPPAAPLAAGEPSLFMPPWNAVPEVSMDAVMDLLFLAVEFHVGGRRDGEPYFFAAGEVAGPDVARFHADSGHGCVYTADAASTGGRRVPTPNCDIAKTVFASMRRWLRRAVKATDGLHEYHEAPWADIVAWMERVINRTARLGGEKAS